LLYLNQARATELTVGMLCYYKMNENESKVFAGLDWRKGDAWIICLGVLTRNYSVRLSYDVNSSYLRYYSRQRGAFEISLVYVGEKDKPFMATLSQF
jgi:hypothetical protein